MIYRQSFDESALLGLGNVDEALDDIRAELAENFLTINNAYCKEKYSKMSDFFVRFPASDDYDKKIDGIIDLAHDVILLGYATIDETVAYKTTVLKDFFGKREELKREMASL